MRRLSHTQLVRLLVLSKGPMPRRQNVDRRRTLMSLERRGFAERTETEWRITFDGQRYLDTLATPKGGA